MAVRSAGVRPSSSRDLVMRRQEIPASTSRWVEPQESSSAFPEEPLASVCRVVKYKTSLEQDQIKKQASARGMPTNVAIPSSGRQTVKTDVTGNWEIRRRMLWADGDALFNCRTRQKQKTRSQKGRIRRRKTEISRCELPAPRFLRVPPPHGYWHPEPAACQRCPRSRARYTARS